MWLEYALVIGFSLWALLGVLEWWYTRDKKPESNDPGKVTNVTVETSDDTDS